jgi:SAM-dependent methyltransferase
MSALERTLLSDDERESMTANPARQDEAFLKGAYAYLSNTALTARYSVISGIIEEHDCDRILDIGCYTGGLRASLNRHRAYHGIDISAHAILEARKNYSHIERTSFTVGDVRTVRLLEDNFTCVVWAGIGFGYSQTDNQSFVDLFDKTCEFCSEDGILIFECIEGYSWIQTHIERVSKILNVLQVTYPLATVHNKRTLFISRKI